MSPNQVTDKTKDQVQANIISNSHVKVRKDVKAGDRIRVLLKQKSFTKSYKPRWSRTVFTVAERNGKYYYIDGDDAYNELRLDRTYLRAHIQKIDGDIEENPNKADLVDTLEGNLKEQGKLTVDETSKQEKERIEKEAIEQQKQMINRVKQRVRKANSKYSGVFV